MDVCREQPRASGALLGGGGVEVADAGPRDQAIGVLGQVLSELVGDPLLGFGRRSRLRDSRERDEDRVQAGEDVDRDHDDHELGRREQDLAGGLEAGDEVERLERD